MFQPTFDYLVARVEASRTQREWDEREATLTANVRAVGVTADQVHTLARKGLCGYRPMSPPTRGSAH